MIKKIETREEFNSFINTPDVVSVVKFGAPWCGPCHVMDDNLESLTDDDLKGAQIGTVNVDDLEDLSVEYNIRNIPALFYFKDGNMVNKSVGLVDNNSIISQISSLK